MMQAQRLMEAQQQQQRNARAVRQHVLGNERQRKWDEQWTNRLWKLSDGSTVRSAGAALVFCAKRGGPGPPNDGGPLFVPHRGAKFAVRGGVRYLPGYDDSDAQIRVGTDEEWKSANRELSTMRRLIATEPGVLRWQSPGDGRSALHWAAACGQEPAVELLLLAGADITAVDHNRRTAGDLAQRRGQVVNRIERGGRKGVALLLRHWSEVWLGRRQLTFSVHARLLAKTPIGRIAGRRVWRFVGAAGVVGSHFHVLPRWIKGSCIC